MNPRSLTHELLEYYRVSLPAMVAIGYAARRADRLRWVVDAYVREHPEAMRAEVAREVDAVTREMEEGNLC